jgi:hypothetical protein
LVHPQNGARKLRKNLETSVINIAFSTLYISLGWVIYISLIDRPTASPFDAFSAG